MISTESKQQLLRFAREAIESNLKNYSEPALAISSLPPELRADGACFVTLTLEGDLRGCIGSLEARQPLALDVQEHAVDAAFHDIRFQPLTETELPGLHIEISILSAPKPLPYQNAEELPGLLRPGVDGVVLARGLRRATFLPQVWEKVDDPSTFLDMLCEKMGFEYDLWRRQKLDVYTYYVESFEEEE
jgi:AmmeMemoRadiSam system protein A